MRKFLLFLTDDKKRGTQLSKEMFFEKANQALFDTVIKCYLKYGKVDYNLVVDMATELSLFETIGGDAYLSELFAIASRFGHYRSYAEVVHEKYILREIMTFAQSSYTQAASETVSSEERIITKYRNGGTGTVLFMHNGAMRRFEQEALKRQ